MADAAGLRTKVRGAGGEMREVLGVGQRHPDTLTAMNNLASTLYELGKHVEAEAMGGEVLAAKE